MLNYIALAAIAGFFLPLQALINARTSSVLGGPLWATLVNFGGGTLMMIVLLASLRAPMPAWEQIGRVPPYGWISGLFGMMVVAQAAYTVPKLGAASMIAILIAGQMFGSLVFDHFAILQTHRPVTLEKVVGALLLIAGAYLILRPDR